MNYTLRPASAVDLSFVRRVHHETLRVYVEPIWGWDEARQDEFVRDWFDPKRIEIVQAAGQDVGILVVEPRTSEIFLESISIVSEMQNRGLGRRIVRDVMARARDSGLPVRLQVLITNERARRFYERLGFEIEREDAAHFKMVSL